MFKFELKASLAFRMVQETQTSKRLFKNQNMSEEGKKITPSTSILWFLDIAIEKYCVRPLNGIDSLK